MSPGAAVTACSVLWEGSGGEGRTVPGERGGNCQSSDLGLGRGDGTQR